MRGEDEGEEEDYHSFPMFVAASQQQEAAVVLEQQQQKQQQHQQRAQDGNNQSSGCPVEVFIGKTEILKSARREIL
jgi:hypothetical protein